jgi:hypothetical protein
LTLMYTSTDSSGITRVIDPRFEMITSLRCVSGAFRYSGSHS